MKKCALYNEQKGEKLVYTTGVYIQCIYHGHYSSYEEYYLLTAQPLTVQLKSYYLTEMLF